MDELGVALKFLLGLCVTGDLDDGIEGIKKLGGVTGVAGVGGLFALAGRHGKAKDSGQKQAAEPPENEAHTKNLQGRIGIGGDRGGHSSLRPASAR